MDAELLAAFKRLGKQGVLRLTKPDSQRYHALEYSGKETEDNSFFFTGPFNAKHHKNMVNDSERLSQLSG